VLGRRALRVVGRGGVLGAGALARGALVAVARSAGLMRRAGRRGGFLGAGRVNSGEKREGGRWERERSIGEREKREQSERTKKRRALFLRRVLREREVRRGDEEVRWGPPAIETHEQRNEQRNGEIG
jgi:hypothetical protein